MLRQVGRSRERSKRAEISGISRHKKNAEQKKPLLVADRTCLDQSYLPTSSTRATSRNKAQRIFELGATSRYNAVYRFDSTDAIIRS